MKAREANFRPYDNQMVMEMYVVRAKDASKMEDQWDIYDALGAVLAERGHGGPGPAERRHLQDRLVSLSHIS